MKSLNYIATVTIPTDEAPVHVGFKLTGFRLNGAPVDVHKWIEKESEAMKVCLAEQKKENPNEEIIEQTLTSCTLCEWIAPYLEAEAPKESAVFKILDNTEFKRANEDIKRAQEDLKKAEKEAKKK